VTHPRDDGIDERLQRSAERRARFDAWLEQLRHGDPRFAEASALHPNDMAAWQAATYLLTGCDRVWEQLGARVLANRSPGCVAEALRQEGTWSPIHMAVMRWAAHLWDGRRNEAGGFPFVFEEFHFRRWVTAVHLRKTVAPALTIVDERRGR